MFVQKLLHEYLQQSLFTIAKKCKQLKCPSTDERIHKMWNIQWNIILAIKRNEQDPGLIPEWGWGMKY
jgi:hypothetical protein